MQTNSQLEERASQLELNHPDKMEPALIKEVISLTKEIRKKDKELTWKRKKAAEERAWKEALSPQEKKIRSYVRRLKGK